MADCDFDWDENRKVFVCHDCGRPARRLTHRRCRAHDPARPPRPVVRGPEGPGTQLKRLLGRFGIRPKGVCKCNQRAAEMDRQGVEWCQQNIRKIVGWLKEEAHRRRLPFSRRLARILVARAIARARKAGARAVKVSS